MTANSLNMENTLQFKAISSAPEKALDGARFVYTSNIIQIDIDFNYINQHFDFGYIEIDSESKAEYKKLIIESSSILNNSGVLLSSYHYKKSSAQFFMTKKGKSSDIVSNNDKLSVTYETLPFDNPHFEFISMQLLCSALPSLMNKDLISNRRAFYSGEKYYRAAYTERKEENVNVMVCIESKICPDWAMFDGKKPSGNIFIAKTVTFTLRSDVEKFCPRNTKMAKRKRKMLRREKFKLGDHGFVVPTHKGGKTKFNDDDIYVKGSIEEDTNNRTDAYFINHDTIKLDEEGIIQDSGPENSRAGHAYRFLVDLFEIYEGKVNVTFGKIEFDRCYSGSKLKTKSDHEYKAIMQALSDYSIRIVNKTTGKHIFSKHIEQLKELSTYEFKSEKQKVKGNINYLYGDQKNTENKPELILLVTDGKDYFKCNKSLVDPYVEYKSAHPNKIIQAVEYVSLFSVLEIHDNQVDEVPLLAGRKYDKKNHCIKGRCAILDCLLAQLHLKLEVRHNRLFIDRKTGQLPKDFSFIYPFRIRPQKDETEDKNEEVKLEEEEVKLEEEEEEEDLEDEIEGEDSPFSGYRYCAVTTDGMHMKFEELSDSQLNDIKDMLGGNCHFVFGKPITRQGQKKYTHDRHPFMINFDTGHYMIFAKTDANAMPNHEVLEAYRLSLVEGRQKPIKRTWLEDYITRKEIAENVVDAVSSMLEKHNDVAFYYQQIQEFFKNFKPKVGKRLSNNDKTTILLDIEKTLGIHWYSKIKTSEMKELISHQDGFMFSRSDKCYYAGNLGSFKAGTQEGFSKIYKIISNVDLPCDIDKWFLSMSVRNRQTTVYPFIFQHAKEYASMIDFKATISNKSYKVELKDEPEYTDAELENYADIDF